jgi:Glu-tRNA(Gln) amidotransferase subunit E-like FAD-binding protein
MAIFISPKNCQNQEKKDADLVLNGETDFQKLAAEAAKRDRLVTILAGTLNGNGGFNPDGSRYLRPGPGVTIMEAGLG